MGGGGASGTVVFPVYIQDMHRDWMNNTGLDSVGISVASVMTNALAPGANPYAGIGYDDPKLLFSLPVQDFATLSSAIDGISSAGNWSDFVTAVKAKMVLDSPLQSIVADALSDSAALRSDEQVTAVLSVRNRTGLNELTDWGNFIGAAVERADNGDVVAIDYEKLREAVQEFGAETVMRALSVSESGIDETTDWASIYDTAIDRIKNSGMIVDVDIEEAITLSLSAADKTIAAAMQAALAASNGQEINALVAAYETTLSFTKGRSLRSFNAGMAGGAAVHTSAFVIGQALIESQFAADVNRFAAEAKLETFKSALSLYNNLVTSLVGVAASSTQGSSSLRSGLLTNSIQGMIDLLSTRVQFQQNLAGLYTTSVNGQASLLTSIEGQNRQSREQYLQQSVQNLNAMQQSRVQYEQSLVDMRMRLFSENITNEFRVAAMGKQAHDNFVSAAVENISTRQAMQLQYRQSLAMARTDATRIRHLASSEYIANDADMNAKFALWDLGIFEKGVNLLAGPSGMAAPLPNSPSKAQSALGGAMGGAAAGAAFGPVGAGIGALIGGGLGLLS